MTTLPLLKDVLAPALAPTLVRALGYALLHSLWQGAVLALLLAGLLLLRRHRAEVRYAGAATALALLLLAVGGTFGYYYQPAAPPEAAALPLAYGVADLTHPAAPAPAPATWLQAAGHRYEPYLPVLVGAWLLGTLLMGGRLAGGLLLAGRLRRAGTQALGHDWQQRLAALTRRAGLRRPVALLESARVAGPLVLGHLRPVILLPLGAVAGLSPALLEALLAHEVAHIARRDYLLNLGLAVAEVLFFYHPAVWFMAGCLRTERENCCDDQAAALCGGDGLRVARALAALAELLAATATPRLALAAAGTGGRGSLLARVRRLALGRPSAPTLAEAVLAGLLTLLGIGGLGLGVALALPAGSKKLLTMSSLQKNAALTPADTTRRRKLTGSVAAPPAPAPAAAAAPIPVAPPASVISETTDSVYTPALPLRRDLGDTPRPRRPRRPQTVVLEKDKKGRLLSLSVDGQPVEVPGKKSKAGKAARTVEIVTVPAAPQAPGRAGLDGADGQPRHPERRRAPENQSFSFDFQVGADADPNLAAAEALRQAQQTLTLDWREAQQGLTESMRNPAFTEAQRLELQRRMERLQQRVARKQTDLNRQLQAFHLSFDQGFGNEAPPTQAERNARQAERNAERAAQNAEQAERNAREVEANAQRAEANGRQAERNAEQAARNARRAEANGRAATANSRRLELLARIAAARAELRALDGPAGQAGPSRMPAPPRPPQGLPAPPPPPPPPTLNADQMRAALRQDGLIGKTDRNFRFELNEQGGRVNGQTLTPAQAQRYRQLLHMTASGSGHSSFNMTAN